MILKRNSGFTLIELVVVIVVLGLLAVTAAPKFINLAGDAKGATLNAIAGSLSTASELIKVKAILNSKYNVTYNTELTFDGLTFTVYDQGTVREVWEDGFIQLISGDFNYLGSDSGLMNTVCSENDFCIIDNLKVENVFASKGGYGMFFIPKGYQLADKNCFAYYAFELSAGESGTLVYKETGAVVDGC